MTTLLKNGSKVYTYRLNGAPLCEVTIAVNGTASIDGPITGYRGGLTPDEAFSMARELKARNSQNIPHRHR